MNWHGKSFDNYSIRGIVSYGRSIIMNYAVGWLLSVLIKALETDTQETLTGLG